MDFDLNAPKFCYRDALLPPAAEAYKAALFARYPGTAFCEVSDGAPDAFTLYIEPDAMADIRRYFHFGKRQPQSMYEQQMALVGFAGENYGAVRYVIPCDGAFRAEDNAIFTKKILKTVDKELKIINNNYYGSEDRGVFGSACDNRAPMRFLGFIHSHPTQSELQYSTGDDAIHARMLKQYGLYAGVLVNPAEETLGAYYGKDLRQARLVFPEEYNSSNRRSLFCVP